MSTLLTQIRWSDHLAIMSKAKTKEEREFENVTILQPTSPFRSGEDIKNAFNLFKEKMQRLLFLFAERSILFSGIIPLMKIYLWKNLRKV